MSSNRKGWHPGEAAIQSQLQFTEAVADAFELIAGSLPEEHRAAHSELNFLPIVTLDRQARPWVSVVTSPTGTSGFVKSTTANVMTLEVKLWDGDPLCDNLEAFRNGGPDSNMLIAGSGIRLDSLRPRYKFSGIIKQLTPKEETLSITLEVNETLGHMPRHLNIRELEPHPHTSPVVEYCNLNLQRTDRLPAGLIDFIHAADTSFFGTSYVAAKRDERRFQSHLGLNNRGGGRGFLRVKPSDGKTIIFPDYTGNHYMNSLGNIEATPVASFAIPCFKSGDILYLTGSAKNFVGKRAQALMPRVNILTTVKITGYIFIRDALPIRQRGDMVVYSPYSPPVCFLAEEKPGQTRYNNISVDIVQVIFKSDDIAIFTFEASREITIRPGEWAMLDCSSVVGRPAFQSAVSDNINSSQEINTERVRTWTVSSSHHAPSRTFEITMQRKADGIVTPPLFNFARKLADGKLDTAIPVRDMLPGGIRLVSTGGEFVPSDDNKRLLWFAGGMGITPFISMLKALQHEKDHPQYGIILLVATRLPDIHIPLITTLFLQHPTLNDLRLTIHVYSCSDFNPQLPPGITLHHHGGRFERASLALAVPDVRERAVWICAPSKLSEVVRGGLVEAGADLGKVRRESFMW